MGQRSQIYIKMENETNTAVVARYFQWNYGERMISRARGIIEWLDDYMDSYYDILFAPDYLEKLIKIAETNFDMRDVVLSANIIEECKEFGESDIFAQDNNDGQLYIDISPRGIKYAFVFYDDFNTPLDGNEYMNADYYIEENDFASWEERFRGEDGHDEDEITYTKDNIRFISEHAELMTEDEVRAFREFDYSPFIEMADVESRWSKYQKNNYVLTK